jgi:hypothetical protein
LSSISFYLTVEYYAESYFEPTTYHYYYLSSSA